MSELGPREKIIKQKNGPYEVIRTGTIEFWIDRKPVTSDLIIPPADREPLVERQQGVTSSFMNSRIGQALAKRK